MIYKVQIDFIDINMIGFTIFVMIVFETFKWWRGDGNYNA